jgi:hypothetical protein
VAVKEMKRRIALALGGATVLAILTAPAPADAEPILVGGITETQRMCEYLDSNPDDSGVYRAAVDYMNRHPGINAREAGVALYIGVAAQCPRNLPILQHFIDNYGGNHV